MWRFNWHYNYATTCSDAITDNRIGVSTSICADSGSCFDGKTFCNDFDESEDWAGGTFSETITTPSTEFALR